MAQKRGSSKYLQCRPYLWDANAKQMTLKKSPNGLLANAMAYSGMAAAFLIQHEAAAQVNYTDLDPDAVLHNETLEIDLDGDGTVDISVAEATYSGNFSAEVRLPSGNSVLAITTFSEVLSPKVLDAGAAIGPLNTDFHADDGNGVVLAQHFTPNWGNWLNKDGYLGCRFIAGDGMAHYGWVEIGVTQFADTVRVKSYGYEQIPGLELLAGEGSPAGINEFSVVGNLLLSPNPAKEELGFDMPDARDGPSSVTLLDPLGNVIRQMEPTPGERVRIDLRTLPPGVYFIRAAAGKRTWFGKVDKL